MVEQYVGDTSMSYDVPMNAVGFAMLNEILEIVVHVDEIHIEVFHDEGGVKIGIEHVVSET